MKPKILAKMRRLRNIIASEMGLTEIEANAIVLAVFHATESATFRDSYGEFWCGVLESWVERTNKL